MKSTKHLLIVSFLLIVTFLLTAIISLAQPPQAFKYQTVVRNATGDIVQNQNISLRFSIRDGSVSGTILYQEIHNVQTSALGLVNIEIGNGILVLGSMSTIDWAIDIKFLQTELDVTGGSSYVTMGTSELLSVPYALYAESTGDQIWSKDGSSVYYNTGNVGIGTDTPGTQLDVQGHIWQSGTGNSVFLGEDAGKDDDLSNNNNTYIGNAAGRNNVSGSNNVAIGYNAGSGNELGSNNIYIGANANSISTGSNDRLNIGNTIYANLSNQQVGIGTTSPIVDLDIRDNDGFAVLNLTSNYGSSRLSLDKENATDAAYINFSTNSTSHWALGTIDDNGLSISREWSSPDGTMYFDLNGNAGIGTLTPGAKLDVAGHIWQTGTGKSVFMGENAGANDDLTDNYNSFIGLSAGQNNTSGFNNVAIGSNALKQNTSGVQNTAIGSSSLASNNEGNYNTAIGNSSLNSNTNGGSNSAFGMGTLRSNLDGSGNTATGFYAMHENTTGDNNSVMGHNALYDNQTGTGNIAIGYSTLSNSTGHYNIGIGYAAGHNLTSGSSNILIASDAPNPTGSNQLYIGEILYGDLNSGNIGIGTTSPGALLDVAGPIWQSGTGNSVFIGENAGSSDDLADNNNTFVGCEAGASNTNGGYNAAYGYGAFADNTYGFSNTAIGSLALASNNGNENTAVGNSSMVSNDSGGKNCAFGQGALYSNEDGNYNSATGYHAMYGNLSGSSNTAHGYRSLLNGHASSQNTAIGYESLKNCTGNDNIAIGNSAGDNITSGSYNIIIGCDAPVATGSNQMYLGGILYGNTSSGRIGIGTTNPSAGLHIKGSQFPNSFLYIEGGTNQDAGIRLYEGTTDKWHIFNNETANGLQIYNTAGKTVFFAQQSSGNVGIGTTSPEHTLHVNGSELLASGPTGGFKFRDRASSTTIDDWVWYSLNDYSFFYKSGLGNIWTIANDGRLGIRRTPTANMLEVQGNASKSTAGSWLANSDKRIKTDICNIENASEVLMQLRPVKFKYTQEWKNKHPEIEDIYYYNFIAQEYKEVFPEAVKGSGEFLEADPTEILQIDSYNAQIVSIKAVQEVIDENKKQGEIIKVQQKSLENLQMEVEKLKTMIREMKE